MTSDPINAIRPVAGMQQDSGFYGELELLLTIKSFDLQAIRKRYLASRGKKSGVAGSVERRDPGEGGIVHLRLSEGKIRHAEILTRMREPRGIDVFGSGFMGREQVERKTDQQAIAIAAENEVYWSSGVKQGVLRDPWFAYLHTVQFHPSNPFRLVLSSSGFDYIREQDLLADKPLFEWLAWEHGYAEGRDPETAETVILTRDPLRAAMAEKEGKRVLLVPDPPDVPIPTARRAAFINSVAYDSDPERGFLATFFHQGCVMAIDRMGKSRTVLEGLRNPHGGRPYGRGTLATSTAQGQVVWQLPEATTRFDLSSLEGKAPELGDWEWVQNSLCNTELIVAIDSNRTAFILIDPVGGRYDKISYDPDWAVQDGVIAKPEAAQLDWIRTL